jgi:hypothetical protein
MAQRTNITSPVGRIVMGSLYDPNTTDAEGKPLTIKSGPNAGQNRVNYFFALAIPKGSEPHWAHTPWGQIIWAVGNQAFPQAAQAQDFSWKIIDGDSRQPGKLFKGKPGKPPCENEGWPGHWILKFSGGFAPKVYVQEGAGYVQATQKDFCKPGYFVEVAFSVEGNSSQTQPGVYLNHSMVCFRGYGQEIQFGPDVASAGFGASPLPAGASMTPPAGAIPMPQAPGVAGAVPLVPGMMPAPGANVPMPGVPGLPSVPAYPSAPGGASPAYAPPAPGNGVPQVPGMMPAPLAPAGSVPMPSAPAPTVHAPIPVMPSPGFVQMPPPVPQVPAGPVRQMTTLAQGPYEAYISQGWTDAMRVQNNLMILS